MTTQSPTYAHRLADIRPFEVMKLLARANALQAEGHDVVYMVIGEPDFPTPAPIIAAGQQALVDGHTKYTPAQGIAPLREAIAEHYAQRHSVSVDPRRVFVTAGGSGGLLLASALLLNPGEGLLMTDPGYPCNRHFLKAFSGEGQLVPVTSATAWQLTGELVAEHWQPETRGVLLASPANPTGTLITAQQLDGVVQQVRARQGHLIVDEIYHGLTYGTDAVTVLKTVPDAFVLNSFSKYFGMTGWRLGWLICPDNAVPELEKLAQNLFICPSSIAQQAALAAFTPASLAIMEQQRTQFQARRDLMVAGLRALGFGVPIVPEGAFYVYASLPDGTLDSEAFCDRLLENYHVAVTPGTDFGFFGANRHVRFSYAQDLDRLALGLERLRRALASGELA